MVSFCMHETTPYTLLNLKVLLECNSFARQSSILLEDSYVAHMRYIPVCYRYVVVENVQGKGIPDSYID